MADFTFEKSLDGYAANYDKLIEKSLRKIDRDIYLILNNAADMPRKSALPYIMANRKKIIDALKTSTLSAFSSATSGGYKAAFDESDKVFKSIKNAQFLETDIELFTMIRQGAMDEMASYAGIDGQRLFDQMVQATLTGNRTALETVLLSGMTGLSIAKHGATVIETNLMTFSRTLNGTRSLNAGIETYIYSGPGPDKIIRPFCEKILGKTFTIEEINKLDNGQMAQGTVFFTCGGWNCRHRWIPVQL
jgi:hypothetical protein